MARELSQEAVLDFLWAAGGRAPNTALLRHFQRFLRDPALTEQQRRERREYFKSLVNSLATVHPAAAPGASKDIVLRRRYRDLLDEELPPPEEQREQEEEKNEPPPPPRRDPDGRRGPRGEAAEQGRPRRGGGCSARGRGGPCCECRRARRAAAAAAVPPPPYRTEPPPYRTQPLSSGPWALRPGGTARPRPPALPSGPGALSPAVPPRSRSPPLPAAGLPSATVSRSRTPPPPPGPEMPPPYRLPQPRSLPQPATGMPLLKAPRPSASPERRTPAGPIPSPLLSSGPRALAPRDLPPSRSLPLLSAPEVLPLSRSLQALPASPSSSPLLLSGPEALASTRLPPSQSRSLQQLPTRPSPDLPRGSRGLTPKGPTQPQVLRLRPCQSLTLPSGPGILPPTRSPPTPIPDTVRHSPFPIPPPSLLPAQGPAVPQAAESQPPAPLPVFQSIRRQLALSKAQGTPSPAHDDCRPQPRSALAKSSPRNAPSRGPLVPLGQREHAWLVAMSAGCWAQVRGLFLEEPELALQRDFISGFTVLHWLAKHGDGPGLQELAAAARQLGLALDVDARSGCGYTPLHLAAIHGHQLVIKVLVLQLGCQVQVRDGSGRRPWEYLGSSTSGEIWQLLEAPRGTIMFPTQPLARSASSVSKVSPFTGRAALPACLRVQLGRGAVSDQSGSDSD
ncbi:ankyrin repeat domain-containing protein SOWAHB [Camarhynchus parvulus]|uniref:ankyrin repeat domain-containing protein SOWAHB n=1 Tax=Geospiza parvula TaxID=87175 RepID=UPI001237E52D|nr:ankyrin repeat domain-containing protein SOWAHB [Camarhynchus parvulus]